MIRFAFATTCMNVMPFKNVFSIIGNSPLCELFTLWERLLRDRCLKPHRITPSLTQSRRQPILANTPSTPQISLPSRSGHIALRCCDFLPQTTFCDHPFALPQWNLFLLAVKCHGLSPLSTAVRAFHCSRRPTQ